MNHTLFDIRAFLRYICAPRKEKRFYTNKYYIAGWSPD